MLSLPRSSNDVAAFIRGTATSFAMWMTNYEIKVNAVTVTALYGVIRRLAERTGSTRRRTASARLNSCRIPAHRLRDERLESRLLLSNDVMFTLLPDEVGPQQFSEFGSAVVVSADYRVVGSPFAAVDRVMEVGMVTVYDSSNAVLTTIENPEPATADRFGFSVALSGTILVVGTPYDDAAGVVNAGSAYVYDLAGGTPAIPVALLHNPNPTAGDEFGRDVAVAGDRVAVSAYLDDTEATDSGKVYVYDLGGPDPTNPNVSIANPSPNSGDRFGWSIALDGNHLVVGAFFDDLGANDAGTAYVFDLASANPSVPSLTIPNPVPETSDQFGGKVAVSGDRVAVGARVDDVGAPNAGTVYVFDLSTATPTSPVHTVYNPFPVSGEQFGHAIAIDGETLVVGAWLDIAGDLGAVGGAYVFDLSSATPTAVHVTLLDPVVGTNDQFGYAVSIAGDVVVVGARFDNLVSGGSFVYDLASPTPAINVASLANTTPAAGDRFGFAVDMNDNFVLIGSPLDDDRATDAGKVLVYDISAGTPLEVMTLYKPNAAGADIFGAAVALSGSRAVVGATRDDNGARDAGSVYIFDLSSATPEVPEFILHNPEPGNNDQFGFSLAIHGDIVAVGTPLDDAHGTDSGTTYVYDLSSPTPTVPLAVLRDAAAVEMDVFGWSVAVHGSHVAVGAPLNDSFGGGVGLTFIYDLASATPDVPLAALSPLVPSGSDGFGFDVALSGDLVVVGSAAGDAGNGEALVYDLSTVGTNQPLYRLRRPMPDYADIFGYSVAIHDNRVVVGELYNLVDALTAGSAYVYDLASSLPTDPIAILNNPTPADNDQYGGSVAAYGNYALIASSVDDSVNIAEGAVYLYEVVNTHPVIDDLVLNVDEDDDGLTPFGVVFAFDAESSVTFQVTGGTGASVFAIDELSGELTTIGELDFETTAAYTLNVTVNDDQGAYASAVVAINVTDVNDAPLAGDDDLMASEDASLTDVAPGVLVNDSDQDQSDVIGSTVLVSAFDPTSQLGAVVVVSPDGSYTYDPTSVAAIQALDAGDITSDTFTYTITDSQGATSTATVTITLTGVNDSPLAGEDADATDEDTLLAGTLLGNDTDADEDDVPGTSVTVTAFDATSVMGAAVVVSPDGSYTYDPTSVAAIQALDAGDITSDTFTYTITDSQGATSTATVTITLTGVNDSPLAGEDADATDEDTPLAGTLLGNDTDADEDDVLGTTVTVTAFDATSVLGAAVVVDSDGSYTYDPTSAVAIQALRANDSSSDTFTYTITDSQGATSTATVTIALTGVNDAPVAEDVDFSQAPLGAPSSEDVIVSWQLGVDLAVEELATDVDDTLTPSSFVFETAHVTIGGTTTDFTNLADVGVSYDGSTGQFTLDPTSLLLYQMLDDGEAASVVLDFTVSDGVLSDRGTATLVIEGANDAVLALDDAGESLESAVIVSLDVLANDTDVDDEPLWVTGIDGTPISVGGSVTLLSGALVSLNPDGTLAYDPQGIFADIDVNATDTFFYAVSDGSLTSTAHVVITITPINEAPVANDDTGATTEDELLSVASPGLLANDTDIDNRDVLGTTVTVTGFDAMSVLGAAVVVSPDGSYTYDPTSVAAIQALDAGDTASDTFTYTITDILGESGTATVTITLTGINDSPLAGEDADATDEDTLLAGTLLDNDTDADENDVPGTTVTVTAFDATSVLGAAVVVSPDGSYTYDPTSVAVIQALDAGDITSDTFTYTITDSQGATSTATVTITLTGVNDSPLAGEDADATDEDTLLAGTLLGNDTDADEDDVPGTSVTVTAFDATSVMGAAVVVSPDGSYTYDPTSVAAIQALDAGDITSDTFTYTITDSQGATSTATVTITLTGVNDSPLAGEDADATDEDTLLAGTLLGNDTDADEDDVLGTTVTVTAFDATSVLGAAVVVDSDGSYTYDPTSAVAIQALRANDSSSDTFTYTITDSQGATSTATVTIALTGVNDAPVAEDVDFSQAPLGAPSSEDVIVSWQLGVDLAVEELATDVDDTLTPSSFVFETAHVTIGGTTTDFTNLADVGVSYDGSTGQFTLDPTSLLLYQMLDDGEAASVVLDFTVSDGVLSDRGTATLVIEGANDAVLALDDAGESLESAVIVSLDVLANDTDVDDEPLWVTGIDGTPISVGGSVTLLSGALVSLNPDGTLAYDPQGIFADIDVNATDTFFYAVSDGSLTSTAHVVITITPINEAPVANDDTGATTEDELLSVASPGLLANDTDIDNRDVLGTTVTVTGFDAMSVLGAAVVVSPDGSYTYDPTSVAAIQALDAGDTASDTFTYTITDILGESGTATVTITLTGINDSPLAGEDADATDEDTLLAGTLLGNDTDADEDDVPGTTVTVTAFDATSVLGAAVVVSPDGSYTYDPTSVAAIQALDAGDTASDTFTYTITDSQGATSTATVTITLTGVNDSPLAGEDADATDEDTPLAGTLLGNDTDADEDDVLGTTVTVTAFDATSVLGAAVVVSPDGSYTYDPTSVAAIQALDAGDTASDTFTYTITDSQGATSTATVTITLTGVNDSPLAGEDADATDEDTLLAGTLLGNDTDADEDDVLGTTVTVTAFDATSVLGAAVVVEFRRQLHV